MRYVVSVMIALPLAMNGMLLTARKNPGVMHKRLFFSEHCDFYKLIADPRHSPVHVDEVIKREIEQAPTPLCLAKVEQVQKKIVLEALKHMSINIAVLQPRFEGERYNQDFNKYNADAHYTYVLAELHRQVKGKICVCDRIERHSRTSQAWDLAYLYNLDHMSDELNLFHERLKRQ